MRLFALALCLLLLLPPTVYAEGPCTTVTSSAVITSYKPKTPLERIYYATSVCWRRRALDAMSEARSSSTSLSARARETAPAPPTPDASDTKSLLLGGAIGLALGAILSTVLLPRLR